MVVPIPPPAILSGIRAAESVEDTEILDELKYVEAVNKWALRLIIDTSPDNNTLVPRQSEWFLVIDPAYPLGSIDMYPSKENSVTATFQHQILNRPGPENLPWRTGKICLDIPGQSLSTIAVGAEPVDDHEERLKWHLTRAVAWVHAAATGTLVQGNDPFELPHCGRMGGIRIVHDESMQSFPSWSSVQMGDWGLVVWDTIPGGEKIVLALAFLTREGKTIRTTRRYEEERHESGNIGRQTGLWWLWPSPVVLEPWQIPLTWDELRAAGKTAGVVVDASLREIARTIRGKDANILMLGYPIPARYGQEVSEVHWQAIRLAKLDRGKPLKGFRPKELGRWYRDLQGAFSGRKELEYILTENWHPDRMQARGRLGHQLRDARIALVGCGALGSVVAEMLVRGGVADVLLIDHESLAAGNLVRHTLSGQEIGKNKASALAQRLATTSPFSSIRANEERFPALRGKIEELLEYRDVVIDCTGSDEVLKAFALGWWSFSRLFVSASVGYKARRTFLFAHRGHFFPQDIFRAKLAPLLQEERALWTEGGETLEGAGCWSPLFPARLDDLFLAAASCVKVIEEFAAEARIEARLIVFEQARSDSFTGLQRHEII